MDGTNNEYIDFCNTFQIPLLYSDEREGVGLSKNRVLKKFPNYKYYFFIEDDVELYDSAIFFDCIEKSEKYNIPHILGGVHGKKINVHYSDSQIVAGSKCGGYFNFFRATELFFVGGWHLCFSKYRRYGHSEHSLRFFNNGFQEYPFIGLKQIGNKIILHDPPHVSKDSEDLIFLHYHPDEECLINKRLKHVPIETLSKSYFNNFAMDLNEFVNQFLLKNTKKYPLLSFNQKRKCFGGLYLFKSTNSHSVLKKIIYFCVSFCCYPLNPMVKHKVKLLFVKNRKVEE
jgi:hypothetical protein